MMITSPWWWITLGILEETLQPTRSTTRAGPTKKLRNQLLSTDSPLRQFKEVDKWVEITPWLLPAVTTTKSTELESQTLLEICTPTRQWTNNKNRSSKSSIFRRRKRLFLQETSLGEDTSLSHLKLNQLHLKLWFKILNQPLSSKLS